jgi:membrane protease YdiL (CAAX protease family)
VTNNPDKLKAQTRLASIVILVAMIGWMLVTFLGGKLGLPVRFAFLADFAALGAFAWALIVLFMVWRQRQKGE